MDWTPLSPKDFANPAIMLAGNVDHAMYAEFRRQLANVPADGLVVVELSTLGGDPEVARMMGEDIRFNSDMAPERRFVFLGKAMVYSAGATFMSYFARANRYLTRGTRLMIHERRLQATVELNGPMAVCITMVRAKLNELETSVAIQNEGFENLVRGSRVSMDELLRRAPENWYLEAQEACDRGLIEAVI